MAAILGATLSMDAGEALAVDGGERRLSESASASSLSFNFARAIATGDPGEVHVVWFDEQVHYRRSGDDGLTWDEPVVLSAAESVAEHAAIATVGMAVYAVWHELAPGRPHQIVFRRSIDRGSTWESEQRLTAPSIGSAHPSIAATASRVHVTWFDNRHGLTEIYTRRSLDRGSTWEPGQRISETEAESWVATVETEGEDVFVGWVDYVDANEEEYLRRSTDGGKTWSAPIRMSVDEADSWAPSIAIDGSTVLLAWFDRRDAGATDREIEEKINEALALIGEPASPPPARDPRHYHIPDFTARIDEKRRRLQAAAPPWIASGGDHVRLEQILREFDSLFKAWSLGWEIYVRRSSDRGESFGPDTRLTFTSGSSARPSVAARGGEVALVWFELGLGQPADVLMMTSRDGGASWRPSVPLTGAAEAVLPSVAQSDGAIHVVWVDSRSGRNEIYYRRMPTGDRRRPVSRPPG